MNNNNKKQYKRRFITLIEMMIVMFLIALITGVVAYNYQGSLERGKVFKTQAGIERLQSVLSLALAENPGASVENGQWKKLVQESAMVKDPDSLIYDGWGNEYEVGSDEMHGLIITSKKYESIRNQRK